MKVDLGTQSFPIFRERPLQDTVRQAGRRSLSLGARTETSGRADDRSAETFRHAASISALARMPARSLSDGLRDHDAAKAEAATSSSLPAVAGSSPTASAPAGSGIDFNAFPDLVARIAAADDAGPLLEALFLPYRQLRFEALWEEVRCGGGDFSFEAVENFAKAVNTAFRAGLDSLEALKPEERYPFLTNVLMPLFQDACAVGQEDLVTDVVDKVTSLLTPEEQWKALKMMGRIILDPSYESSLPDDDKSRLNPAGSTPDVRTRRQTDAFLRAISQLKQPLRATLMFTTLELINHHVRNAAQQGPLLEMFRHFSKMAPEIETDVPLAGRVLSNGPTSPLTIEEAKCHIDLLNAHGQSAVVDTLMAELHLNLRGVTGHRPEDIPDHVLLWRTARGEIQITPRRHRIYNQKLNDFKEALRKPGILRSAEVAVRSDRDDNNQGSA
ncbi:hypothetical protein [Martelella sp. HB161492]|uniref:hypothetical protein n=1 Tax=Martelella sp. HB161492 TaxID=2720726 RepID=UPI001591DDFD|nr:hypothetical protein [Martelella sp. HB161492]